MIPRLQRWFNEREQDLESVDRYVPPFDDVSVELVQADRLDASETPAGALDTVDE